jgi:hypothetical protein
MATLDPAHRGGQRLSEAEHRRHVRALLRELAELGWQAVIRPDSEVTLQAAWPDPKKLGFELRWRFRQHRRDSRRLIREGG